MILFVWSVLSDLALFLESAMKLYELFLVIRESLVKSTNSKIPEPRVQLMAERLKKQESGLRN